MNGMLIINKPLTWSSMDVIRKLRRITGIKKIGHAGTLDPLATGVLLVCIGKTTKKINELMVTQKEYIADIDLSVFSTTDDAEGELSQVSIKNIPSQEQVEQIISSFIGTIEQTPPTFSAIKIGGKPAYQWAREGKEVPIAARSISIDAIDILSYDWPKLQLIIRCGKGTYIRSLARDIGIALKTGGYLTGLIRTKVGPYTIKNALDISTLNAVPASALISLE
jgi:tRNA pseudouridine55 synthase